MVLLLTGMAVNISGISRFGLEKRLQQGETCALATNQWRRRQGSFGSCATAFEVLLVSSQAADWAIARNVVQKEV